MRKASYVIIVLLGMITAGCSPVLHTAHHSTPDRLYMPSSSSAGHVYTTVYPVEVWIDFDHSIDIYPQRFIIADGEYHPVAYLDERGHHSEIYVHYDQQILHFDRDRSSCRGHRSPGLKHHKGWNNGEDYDYVDLGYDRPSKVNIKVRNTSKEKHRHYHAKNLKKQNHTKTKNKHAALNKTPKGTKQHIVSSQRPIDKPDRVVQIRDNHAKRDRHQTIAHADELPVYTRSQNHEKTSRVKHQKHVKARTDNHKRTETTLAKKSTLDRKERREVVAHNDKQISNHRKGAKHEKIDHITKTTDPKVDKKARTQTASNKNHKGNKSQHDTIMVTLKGGSVYAEGKNQKINTPTKVRLKTGEKKRVKLVTKGGKTVSIPITYKNGILSLARQGKSFHNESSWQSGKSYTINTDDKYRLNNVKLTVVSL